MSDSKIVADRKVTVTNADAQGKSGRILETEASVKPGVPGRSKSLKRKSLRPGKPGESLYGYVKVTERRHTRQGGAHYSVEDITTAAFFVLAVGSRS